MPKTIAQIIAETALAAVNAAKQSQPQEPYEGQSRAGSSSMQMQRDQRWSQYVAQKAKSSAPAARSVRGDDWMSNKSPAEKEWIASHPGSGSGEVPEPKEPEKKLDWLAAQYGTTNEQLKSTGYLGERRQRDILKSSMRDLYSTRTGETKPENFDDPLLIDPAIRSMADNDSVAIDYRIVTPDLIYSISKSDSTTGMKLAKKYLDTPEGLDDDGYAKMFDIAFPAGARTFDGKTLDYNEYRVVRGAQRQGELQAPLMAVPSVLSAISDIPHAITTELGYARQRQKIMGTPGGIDPTTVSESDAASADPSLFDISKLPPYYRMQVDPTSVSMSQYKQVSEQIPDGRGGLMWTNRIVETKNTFEPEKDPVRNAIYQTIVERSKANLDFAHRASGVYTPSMWLNEVVSLPSKVSESVFSALEGRPYNPKYGDASLIAANASDGDKLVERIKKIEAMIGQPLDRMVISELPKGLSKEVQDQLIETARKSGANPGKEYFSEGLDWTTMSRSLDLLGVPKSRQEEIATKLGYTIGEHKVVENRNEYYGSTQGFVTSSYTTFTVKDPDRRVSYDDVAKADISFMDANGDVVESASAPNLLFEYAMRDDMSKSRTNGVMDFVGDVLLDVTNYAPFSIVWKPFEKLFEGAIAVGKLAVKGVGLAADLAISAPVKVANKIVGKELIKAIPDHLVTDTVKQLFTETVNSSALKFARRVFVATASVLKPGDLFGEGANDFVTFKLPSIAEAARAGDKIELVVKHGVSPTAVNNVIDMFRSTEKFLADIADESIKEGPEEAARMAMLKRAKGYLKGVGEEIVEARSIVEQRISKAISSGHYDDLVSAAHVIEDVLRSQADDSATAAGTVEITAKILNEGQIAYGNAKLGVKNVVETSTASDINRISGRIWGAWTNMVLTLRPGWQVVNYIDNTFRMLTNGELIDLSGKHGGLLMSSSKAEDILSKRYGLTRADISAAIRRYYGDDADQLLGIISEGDGRIFDPVVTSAINSLKKYAKAMREGGEAAVKAKIAKEGEGKYVGSAIVGGAKSFGSELWSTLKSVQPRIEGGAAIKVFAREYSRVFDPLFEQISRKLPEGLIPSVEEIAKKFDGITWLSSEDKIAMTGRMLDERARLQSGLFSVAQNMALNPAAYSDAASAATAVIGNRAAAFRAFIDTAMPKEIPSGDLADALKEFISAHLDGVNWADDMSVKQLEELTTRQADVLLGVEKVVKTAQKITENPPAMSEFAEREVVRSGSVDVTKVTSRAEKLISDSKRAEQEIANFSPALGVDDLASKSKEVKPVRGMYLDTMNAEYNRELERAYTGLNKKAIGYEPSRSGAMRDVLKKRISQSTDPDEAEFFRDALAKFDKFDREAKLLPTETRMAAWQKAGLNLPYRDYMRELETRVGSPIKGFSWNSEEEVRAYLNKYFYRNGQVFQNGERSNDLIALERYAQMKLQLLRIVDEKTPVRIKVGSGEWVERAISAEDLLNRDATIDFSYRFGGKSIKFDWKKTLETKKRKAISTMEYIDNGYIESGRTVFKVTRGTWSPVIDVNSQTDQLVRLVRHDVANSVEHTPGLNRISDEVENLIDLANVRASVAQDASPALDDLTRVMSAAASEPVDMADYVDLVAAQGEAIGGAPLPDVGVPKILRESGIDPKAKLNAESLRSQLLGVIKEKGISITDEDADALYQFMVFTANANDLSSGWELGTTLAGVNKVTGEKWGGEAVFQAEKTPLFSQSDDGYVRGFNQHVFSEDAIDSARSIIGLLQGADADTAFEEWSHHLFKMQSGERKAVMYGWAKAPKDDLTGELLSHYDVSREINQIVSESAMSAGQSARLAYLRSVEPAARRADEQLVKAFRKYVMVGIAPNSKIKEVFDQVKQILIRSWQSIKAFARIKITPELRAAFDDMLGADPDFISEQMKPLMKANAYMTGRLPTDLSDLRKIVEDVSGVDLNAGIGTIEVGGRLIVASPSIRPNVSDSMRHGVKTVIDRLEKLGEMYADGQGILTGDYDEAVQRFAIAARKRAGELRELLDYAEQNKLNPAAAWRSGEFPTIAGKYPKLISDRRALAELEKQRAGVSGMTEFGTRTMVDAKTSAKLTANKSEKLMALIQKGDIDALMKAYDRNMTLAGGKSGELLESIRAAIIAVHDRILKGEDTYYDALTGKAVSPEKLELLRTYVGNEEMYRALSPGIDRAYLSAGVVRSPDGLDFSGFDIKKFKIERPMTKEDALTGIEDQIDRLHKGITSTKIDGYTFEYATIPDASIRDGDWESLTEELLRTKEGKAILDMADTKMDVKSLRKLVNQNIKSVERANKLWDSISEFLPRDRMAEVNEVIEVVGERLKERPSLVKIIAGFQNDLKDLVKSGSGDIADFGTLAGKIDEALLIPGRDVPAGVLAQGAAASQAGSSVSSAIPKWFDAMKAAARAGNVPDMSMLALLSKDEQRQVMDWLSGVGKQVADASHIAQQRAGQRVNDVLMDYNTTLGIDAFLTRGPTIQSGRLEGLEPVRVLGGFVPFAKFPRMNMLYMIEQLKHRPQMVRWYQEYQDNINAERRAKGLSEQAIPSIPVEVGDTSVELNPMALLSGKMAVNAFTGYIPEYLSPSEKFLAQIKNLGFSVSPGVQAVLMAGGFIRPESASYFSVIPQGQLASVFPGLPKAVEDRSPLLASLLGVTSPGDSRGIIKQLGYNALAEIENASEWNKKQIAKEYVLAMQSQSGPKWDTASSDYYDSQGGPRVIGYFTGSYPRMKTDEEKQYQQYRQDLATLRNTLDGMSALDDDTRARLEIMISDTPESRAQTIINTASPRDSAGNLVIPTDAEQKKAQELVANKAKYDEEYAKILSDYFSTHQVKVGLSQFDSDWSEVTVRLNQLEQDYYGRLPSYSSKPRTPAEASARIRSNFMSLLSNSKPAYSGDYAKWKSDVETWRKNIPEIASNVWESLGPVLRALGQPTEMPEYLRNSANPVEMDKFDARFYTLDRAMGEVWSKNYYDGYWSAVNGKVGKERLLAEREYYKAHPLPSDGDLYRWLESDIFKGRFSKSDVASRVKELGGVASIKDKILQGKDFKSIQGDELSDLLARIPPGREFFRFKDSLSPEMQRFFDAYTVDNYKPLTDDQKWSDFYNTLKPMLEAKYSSPSDDLVKEWISAEQLDKQMRADRERRWPGIGDMVTAYGPMSTAERKLYRAEHPEISLYYDWLYNEFAPGNPLWSKYYSSDSQASSSGQASSGYGTVGGGYTKRYYKRSGGGGGGGYSYSSKQEPYQDEAKRAQWIEFKSLLGGTLFGELSAYWGGSGGISQSGSDLLRTLYSKYSFGASSYDEWLDKVLPGMASAMLPGHSIFSDPNYFNFQYQQNASFSDNRYWFSNTTRRQ